MNLCGRFLQPPGKAISRNFIATTTKRGRGMARWPIPGEAQSEEGPSRRQPSGISGPEPRGRWPRRRGSTLTTTLGQGPANTVTPIKLLNDQETERIMKVLMVLTSHDQLGNTGRKTGFWLEELAAPYYVFKDAGVQITLASPKGGRPPLDPKSNE